MERTVNFTSKGLELQGVLHLPIKVTKSAVIFANGNPDSYMEHHLPIAAARAFCENGYAALRFNPRGRDPSKGAFVTYNGMVNQSKDIESAISFIKKKGFERIGLVGHSMGGAAAIMADKRRVDALVLWEPASIGFWKKFWLKKRILKAVKKQGYYPDTKYGYLAGRSFVNDIAKMKSKEISYRLSEDDAPPVLLIYGSKTSLSPYAERFLKAAREPKSLKIINGAAHTFDTHVHEKLLLKHTIDWLDKYLL